VRQILVRWDSRLREMRKSTISSLFFIISYNLRHFDLLQWHVILEEEEEEDEMVDCETDDDGRLWDGGRLLFDFDDLLLFLVDYKRRRNERWER